MYFLPVLLVFAASLAYYFGRKEGNKEFMQFAYIAFGLAIFSGIIVFVLVQILTL